MKKSKLLLIVLVLNVFVTNAQTSDDYIELARDILKTEKKSAVAEGMNLADAEIVPFWELYNEYNNKLSLTQNQRVALIKEYAANYETMTDDKADDMMQSYFKYQQELLKLKKSYYARFKKILPPGKVARYFQLENKIQALVDAELALQIPLIEVE
jgi:ABC-type histidine transport system ATPase subunit